MLLLPRVDQALLGRPGELPTAPPVINVFGARQKSVEREDRDFSGNCPVQTTQVPARGTSLSGPHFWLQLSVTQAPLFICISMARSLCSVRTATNLVNSRNQE